MLSNWAEAAEALGLTEIAFTDHAACCGGIDLDALARAQQTHPQVRLRAGVEFDNGPDGAPVLKWIEKHFDDIDITLGVVTTLGGWAFSHPSQQEEYARRDPARLFDAYYHEMRLLLATGVVDCITEFDLIKIFGAQPPPEIFSELSELFEMIHAAGISIQICSSGYRSPAREPFPSATIIEMAGKWGIPFTVGSGAHTFAQLADHFERLALFLSENGVKQVAIYERHRAQLIDLPQ
jgi:histidinol-phosphatase (PHP family)